MTAPVFEHCLFVGGTGMLEAAARHAAELSRRLTLGARRPESLAKALGVMALPLDWHDRSATVAALATLDGPAPDLLISWLHDDGVWLAAGLEGLLPTAARTIRVHGSDSRDPARRAERDPNPRADLRRQTVILGWVNEPEGRRWLTDAEISSAVIRAIDRPGENTVIAGALT